MQTPVRARARVNIVWRVACVVYKDHAGGACDPRKTAKVTWEHCCGGHVDALWDHLEEVGVNKGRKHPVFGDTEAQLTKLVKERCVHGRLE